MVGVDRLPASSVDNFLFNLVTFWIVLIINIKTFVWQVVDLLNTLKHLSQIYHLIRKLIDKLNGYRLKYLVDSSRITDTIESTIN